MTNRRDARREARAQLREGVVRLAGAEPRPEGVLIGFRRDDLEVGILFYGGATRNKVWQHRGYGDGYHTTLDDPKQSTQFPLHIVMSCGSEATYDSAAKIPPQSRDCACAAANHWMVLYLDNDPNAASPLEKETS